MDERSSICSQSEPEPIGKPGSSTIAMDPYGGGVAPDVPSPTPVLGIGVARSSSAVTLRFMALPPAVSVLGVELDGASICSAPIGSNAGVPADLLSTLGTGVEIAACSLACTVTSGSSGLSSWPSGPQPVRNVPTASAITHCAGFDNRRVSGAFGAIAEPYA